MLLYVTVLGSFKRGEDMRFSVRPKSNLSWIVIPTLIASWALGFVNGWIAISLFIIYFLVMFSIMKRNPIIQREAQEFGRQVLQARNDREKERISQALQNSVQIRRKGNQAN